MPRKAKTKDPVEAKVAPANPEPADAVETVEVAEAPEFLSDVTRPVIDPETGQPVDIHIDQDMHMALTSLRSVLSIVTSYAGDLRAGEALLSTAFLDAVTAEADGCGKAIRARIEELAAEHGGGKIETDAGTILVTEVAPTTAKVPTAETTELLEDRGLLPRAVEMVASMREGVNVEAMPAEDLDVLRKYFEIELVPSMTKIEALVTLGAIPAADIEATLDEVVARKGHVRIKTTIAEDLAGYFRDE